MCVCVCACVCACVCEAGVRGREEVGGGGGEGGKKERKKEKEKSQLFPWCHLLCLGMTVVQKHLGLHHLPSAPPEKRWFLDINLTWGHSISLPKGTAGFSNLLCQMREFRDLREKVFIAMSRWSPQGLPQPHLPTIQIRPSPHLFRRKTQTEENQLALCF